MIRLENNQDVSQNLSRRELVIYFLQSQMLLLTPALLCLWFFYLRQGYLLGYFYSVDNLYGIFILGTVAAILGMIIQLLAWKKFTVDAFDDGGINKLLLMLPMSYLVPMFAFGAFVEEILIRGVVQTGLVNWSGSLGGLLITSALFTLLHIRYLKKPVLFTGVFLLSIVLGYVYLITGTLWASIWAHFLYNSGSSLLAKRYYLPRLNREKNVK